jgi:hypothetical protein
VTNDAPRPGPGPQRTGPALSAEPMWRSPVDERPTDTTVRRLPTQRPASSGDRAPFALQASVHVDRPMFRQDRDEIMARVVARGIDLREVRRQIVEGVDQVLIQLDALIAREDAHQPPTAPQ